MEKKETDILIAEFMGCSLVKNEPLMRIDIKGDGKGYLFHCPWHPLFTNESKTLAWLWDVSENWDWLMPVGKRILDITSNQDRPNVNACNNLDWLETEISCHIREYNIDAAYEAIVTFIQAYNKLTV